MIYRNPTGKYFYICNVKLQLMTSKTKFLLIAFSFWGSLHLLHAQNITIKGKVDVSITKGTIQCDFTLSKLPRIKDYYILLNAGLNIRNIRDTADTYDYYYNSAYNDKVSNEGFEYYIPDNTGKGKFLPKGLQISYVGAFPVISDTLTPTVARQDWKGNIAFNGKTIRATEQSAWYPIFYDVAKDKQYTKVAYDIDVTCNDCNTVYLNGSKPVKGTLAHFKSDSAMEPLLFAGNYTIDTADNTYFLNTSMSKEQLKEFGEMTDSYKKYYAKNLSIPYTYDITYIQTTPTSKENGFLFVTYPTITTVGRDNGFNEVFGKNANRFRPFIAHELGHYYFGNYAKFNSELGMVIEESFAEFLSFKVCENLIADSVYTAKINEDIKELKDFKTHPIGADKDSLKDVNDDNEYKYVYFPIILTAVEKEIGEKKMWKWMQLLLTTKTEFTNYDFLKSTLKAALKDDSKLDYLEKTYFKSDSSLQNAIATIKMK